MKIIIILLSLSVISVANAQSVKLAKCNSKLEEATVTDIFLNDAIFLERAATQFYNFDILSSDFIQRLNIEIDDPHNLAFIQGAINLPVLERWFESVTKNQKPSKDFVLAMNKILESNAEFKNPTNNFKEPEAKFPLTFSNNAIKGLQEIKNSQNEIGVNRTLSLLQESPSIRTLMTHKLDRIKGPDGQTAFTSYANNGYRVLWYYGPNPRGITVMSVIPHKGYRHQEAVTANQ